MALLNITSPHMRSKLTTSKVMLWVALATLPGFAALTWWFGWGTLINLLIAIPLAIATEAIILAVRRRPLGFFLKDNSALLTAVLLALALPPYVPWWVTATGVLFAIVFAKQLYGGLGNNPFNPAMAGYALCLVSFPVAMTTHWAAPSSLQEPMAFGATVATIFGNGGREVVDAFTMATPLDFYKHEIIAKTSEEVLATPLFQNTIAGGWAWVNAGFLLGGLVLIWRGIISWHIPVSMLASLALFSVIFGWDADAHVPVTLHLLAGGTMLGAFFIATDPVSAATSKKGKLYYGAGIGALIYIIRTWGAYPDAVAFAVLLMNFAAPFLDYYSRPRTYGHRKARQGLKGVE